MFSIVVVIRQLVKACGQKKTIVEADDDYVAAFLQEWLIGKHGVLITRL